MKNFVGGILVGALFAGGAVALARPVTNIDPARHPNLAAAQQLAAQAWDKVSAAQVANQWDMQGHAQKAKDMLETINTELKAAALAANANAK